MRKILMLVVLFGIGCGGGDPELYGMKLDVRTSKPNFHKPEFKARLHDMLKESAAMWDASPEGFHYFKRIVFVDGEVNCGAEDPKTFTAGCTDLIGRTIVISTFIYDCPEALEAIPHETGHALMAGDPWHKISFGWQFTKLVNDTVMQTHKVQIEQSCKDQWEGNGDRF